MNQNFIKKLLSYLHILIEIYPPFLLLIVFSPIFIGFVIDPELSDPRYIVINLVWLPIFTLPNVLLQKELIYKIIASLYFIIGLLELAHWIILKGPITTTSLLVISNHCCPIKK